MLPYDLNLEKIATFLFLPPVPEAVNEMCDLQLGSPRAHSHTLDADFTSWTQVCSSSLLPQPLLYPLKVYHQVGLGEEQMKGCLMLLISLLLRRLWEGGKGHSFLGLDSLASGDTDRLGFTATGNGYL